MKARRKPALPYREIGEGDYTEDRKAWVRSLKLEDIRAAHEKYGDAYAVAAFAAKKRKRKAKQSPA